jgi:hypothetical protein
MGGCRGRHMHKAHRDGDGGSGMLLFLLDFGRVRRGVF